MFILLHIYLSFILNLMRIIYRRNKKKFEDNFFDFSMIKGIKKNLRGPLAEEIDKINRIKRSEATKLLETEGDCLPNCNLSIWMRDYQKDINEPLEPSEIKGCIPDWLEGTLIRNGPGKQSFGDSKFNHLFDCSAVLHKFKISKGKCTYQNKVLKTKTYLKNEAAQRIVVTEFGTAAVPDPCKTIFDRISSIFSMDDLSDNCMISVYPFGDKLFALTEFPVMTRIDEDSLETIESVNISNHVNIVHHTSHPHVTSDKSVYNLGLSIGMTGPKYSIVKFSSETTDGESILDKGSIEVQIPTRWPFHPSYMHTFGITPNYYIIVEQPLAVSVKSMITSKFYTNQPMVGNLVWFNEYTLIHVIHRETGCKKTYKSEPFFYLHIINQYEENDENLIIDVCAYKDPSMIDCMYFEALKNAKKNPEYANMFRGRPIRLRLPLNETNVLVTPQILCSLGCETPRIDYDSKLGKYYRYFYAISSDVDLQNPGTLIKVDIEKKDCKIWNDEGCFPSEPVFVPNSDQKSEDDGVILSALLWTENENKVSLVVIDAKDFVEIARATFITPGPVPKCLHGWFSHSS